MIHTPHSDFVFENKDLPERLASYGIEIDVPLTEVYRPIVFANAEELSRDFYRKKAEREIEGDFQKESSLKAEVFKEYMYDHGLVKENSVFDALLKGKEQDGKAGKVSAEKMEEFLSFRFDQALVNTDCMRKLFGIGEAQMIFSENKELNPEKSYQIAFTGLSEEKKEQLTNSGIDIPLMLKQRGFYHETMHCLGTSDERKCDVFAMLKLLAEYQNPVIYEVFANSRLNGMMYPLAAVHEDFERREKDGFTSYLMTNTLKKMKELAYNPDALKQLRGLDDKALIEKTLQMVDKNEHSDKSWRTFREQISRGSDKPLTREQLLSCDLFRDMMALAGVENEAQADAFIKERFLPGALKNIQCNGELTEEEKQTRFSEVCRALKVSPSQRKEEEKTRRKEQNDFSVDMSPIFELAASVLKENPEISRKEAQKKTAFRLIDRNMEEIGNFCRLYSENPSYCFDKEKQKEITGRINSLMNTCERAGLLARQAVHKTFMTQKTVSAEKEAGFILNEEKGERLADSSRLSGGNFQMGSMPQTQKSLLPLKNRLKEMSGSFYPAEKSVSDDKKTSDNKETKPTQVSLAAFAGVVSGKQSK